MGLENSGKSFTTLDKTLITAHFNVRIRTRITHDPDLEESYEFQEEIRIARIECFGETNSVAANSRPTKLA